MGAFLSKHSPRLDLTGWISQKVLLARQFLGLATATAMSSCTSAGTRHSSVLSLIPNYMMIALLPSGRCYLICRVMRHERAYLHVCARVSVHVRVIHVVHLRVRAYACKCMCMSLSKLIKIRLTTKCGWLRRISPPLIGVESHTGGNFPPISSFFA